MIEFYDEKKGGQKPSAGSSGMKTQMPGVMASVSALAEATGGIRRGGLVEVGNG